VTYFACEHSGHQDLLIYQKRAQIDAMSPIKCIERLTDLMNRKTGYHTITVKNHYFSHIRYILAHHYPMLSKDERQNERIEFIWVANGLHQNFHNRYVQLSRRIRNALVWLQAPFWNISDVIEPVNTHQYLVVQFIWKLWKNSRIEVLKKNWQQFGIFGNSNFSH
jgi:hypothetical protein